MKLAVVGSRTFADRALLDRVLAEYRPDEIISGGSTAGADVLAAAWAREHGIPLTEFRPDYDRFGKLARVAPLRRNDTIVEACDLLIAFWDGKSKGTAYILEKAQSKGKPVRIISFGVTKRTRSTARGKKGSVDA